MTKPLTLSEFVKKRNGVPLGHPNSLRNMMIRSLGAGSFASFWTYWNPIWGYYLGNYIFKPLKQVFPAFLAWVLTFVCSGFLHDLAIMAVKRNFTLLLTPWFLFMGICVILGEALKIDYSKFPWSVRALINLLIISCCLVLAYQVRIQT